MRRLVALALFAVALVLPASAAAQDSLAPKGAPEFWLPNEEWVNLLWLPYDESRLYALLKMDRGDVFRWVRDDADHTLAQLGARQGYTPHALAEALIAPRRKEVSPRMAAVLVARAERTLTQGHLGQHLLFHSLHQTAIPSHAAEIFGTRDRETFLRLRRAELSPLQICELNGSTRTDAQRGVAKALTDAVHRGVRDRLAQPHAGRRDARPPAAPGPALARADPLQRPVRRRQEPPAAVGRLREAPDASRPTARSSCGTPTARRSPRPSGAARSTCAAPTSARRALRGEPAGPRRLAPAALGLQLGRWPPTARAVAFESAESTYPLGKRVGQMTVMVRDLRTGQIEQASATPTGPRAPRRARPTTRASPPTGASSRSRPPTAAATAAPSRNGLWVVDRRRAPPLVIADDSVGAAYLPEARRRRLGRRVHLRRSAPRAGRRWVWLRSLRDGRPELVSRADGRAGAPPAGDAYDPSRLARRRVVAFISRASNLGGDGRHARGLRARPAHAARRSS